MKRFLAIVLGFLSLEASATTYYVDISKPDNSGNGLSWDTAKKTIQVTIDIASENDTIIVTNGIYGYNATFNKGKAVDSIYHSLSNIVCLTKNITIKSVNGPSFTTIQGRNTAPYMRALYMSKGTVSGFSITGGRTKTYATSLDLEGGGAFIDNGVLTNCVVYGNYADTYGGGICVSGWPIAEGSKGTVVDCNVLTNSSELGGGLAIKGYIETEVFRCSLKKNSADGGGGGLMLSAQSNGPQLKVTGCLLSYNFATNGGGVYSYVYNGGNSPYFTSTTIASNTATLAGGFWCPNGTNRLENCIFYGNSASANYTNFYCASFQLSSYCCSFPLLPGVGNISADPKFTNDFQLGQNSPCIDSGNDGSTSYDIDLAGNTRHNRIIDMGALENQSTNDPASFIYYVNAAKANNSGDGLSWGTAKKTIQAAIDLASPLNTILVTNGIYGYDAIYNRGTGHPYPGTYSLSNIVCLTKNITIKSVNGPSFTTIQGRNTTPYMRPVFMDNGTLNGFSITGGRTLTGEAMAYGPDTEGGGVYIINGNLTNCIIRDNKACLRGGGVMSSPWLQWWPRPDNLRVNIADCLIATNTSAYAGGIFLYDDADTTVFRTKIISNTATQECGGAESWRYSDSKPCKIVGCLVAKNVAYSQIGGVEEVVISAGGPLLQIHSTTITGNSAPDVGGYYGKGTVNNCIIYGNIGTLGVGHVQNTIANADFNYSCVYPLPYGGTGNIDQDPLFLSDYRLSKLSPCIDSGDDGGESYDPDLAGRPRYNGRIDMGAYEYGATTLYVDNARPDNSGNGFTWATAKKTIQGGVDAALQYDTVIVTNGTYSIDPVLYPGSKPQPCHVSGVVSIAKEILVKSVNGPLDTIIQGPGTDNYAQDSAAFGVWLQGNGTLSGFTVKDAATQNWCVNYVEDYSGAGVRMFGGTLTNCLITSNRGRWGGGIYAGTSNNIIADCVISNNTGVCGGGVYSLKKSNYTNRFFRCVISDNVLVSDAIPKSGDGNGGGVFYTNNLATRQGEFLGCLIDGNTSFANGGAMFVSGGGNPIITSCTIVSNSAASGGGIYNGGVVSNSIVYGNAASTYTNYYSGTYNYSCTFPSASGTGNISKDPRLGTSFVPSEFSPCLDAGNSLGTSYALDLLGDTRIFRGRIDMGAFENQMTLSDWYVDASKSDDSENGRTWDSARKTISSTVTDSVNGDNIWVTNGTYTENIAVPSAKTLKIKAVSGASKTTLITAATPLARNFSTDVANASCVIDGFWMTKNAAIASTNYSGGAYGGTIQNCVISNCTAQIGGGFIFSTVSNSVIADCTAYSKAASVKPYGGGGYSGTVYDCRIENCQLTGKTNLNGYGAGLYGSTAYRTKISGCSATTLYEGYGGGAAKAKLYDCIIYSNRFTAGTVSNGVYYTYPAGAGASDSELHECTVYGNYALGSLCYNGGVSRCTNYNSIIFNNSDQWTTGIWENADNWYGGSYIYCDTTPAPTSGVGNITGDPLIDTSTFAFTSGSSPAKNAGTNDYVTVLFDFYMHDRISEGTVDMGAVEYVTVADPVFTPNPNSTLTNSFVWTASNGMAGTEIYFTTNGVTPINEANPSNFLYSEPLGYTFYTNVEIKARAFGAGLTPSGLITSYYQVVKLAYLSVSDGFGSGYYDVGSTVAITANDPVAEGSLFYRWTGDVYQVYDVSSSNTTVLLPTEADTHVFAAYWGPFTVTVAGGKINGTVTNLTVSPLTTIDITADEGGVGLVFDHWDGDWQYLPDRYTNTLSVVVTNDFNVIAAYEPASNTLTVVDGSGSGTYPRNAVVPIVSTIEATNDFQFWRWVGDVGMVADVKSPSTTVTMKGDYTVTATAGYTTYLVYDLVNLTSTNVFEIEISDIYKTDKIAMRKIPQGAFLQGSPLTELGRDSLNEGIRSSVITNPFYVSLFEITQAQWEHIMGANGFWFTNEAYSATRPAEMTSYDEIRGNASGTNFPSSADVDSTSFLGKMRSNFGESTFDLPTESQWEYACRAGTLTALNSGSDLATTREDTNTLLVARFYPEGAKYGFDRNSSTDAGTAKAGSYLPNAWGIYDMHGNVWEWCRDWYGAYPSTETTNYYGPATGNYRVLRGGGYGYFAKQCRSAYRTAAPSSSENYYDGMGFRLVCEPLSHDDATNTLTVVDGSGSGDYKTQSAVLITATNVPYGSHFSSWICDPAGVDIGFGDLSKTSAAVVIPPIDIVMTPTYAANVYSVSYLVNNGTVSGNASQQVEHGNDAATVSAVPDAGYHFVSWEDGVLTAERTDTGITSNSTFYADCEKDVILPEFSTNEVYSDEGTTNIISVRLSDAIAYNGYVSIYKSGSERVSNTVWSLYFTTNNYNVWQNWTSFFVNSYSENVNDSAVYTFYFEDASTNITVHENDLDGISSIKAYPSNTLGYVSWYPAKAYYRSNDAIQARAYINQGYTFKGWTQNTNDSDGLMVNPTNILYTKCMTNTLWALFSPTNIVTAFYTNMSYFASQTNIYKSVFPELPSPDLIEGKTFAGWYTGTNGAGTRIQQGDTVAFPTNFSVHAYFAMP